MEVLIGFDEFGKFFYGYSVCDGYYNVFFVLMDWVERKKLVDVLIVMKWRNDLVDNEIIR